MYVDNTLVGLLARQEENCPPGTEFFNCGLLGLGFSGCCSSNPCGLLGGSCPDEDTPVQDPDEDEEEEEEEEQEEDTQPPPEEEDPPVEDEEPTQAPVPPIRTVTPPANNPGPSTTLQLLPGPSTTPAPTQTQETQPPEQTGLPSSLNPLPTQQGSSLSSGATALPTGLETPAAEADAATDSSDDGGFSLPPAAIAGMAIGGVALIVLIAAFTYFRRGRRLKRKADIAEQVQQRQYKFAVDSVSSEGQSERAYGDIFKPRG